MSGTAILVLGAVVSLGLFLLHRASTNAQRRREGFQMLAAMSAGANHAVLRKPDMTCASRAFATVALARTSRAHLDLDAFVVGQAQSVLDNGGTEDEAQSAHWGAIYGAVADLNAFRSNVESYVEAYEETAKKFGREAPGADQNVKFYMAASMMLTLVLTEHPEEYERFLRHVGR